MAQSMDTTPDAVPNGVAGATAHGPFADERGRLRGVALWYNVTLKFGFIVPEDPNAPVFRVAKNDITAESDADDVQALQTNEVVHFTPSADGISALSVTNTNEGGVNFQKKLDRAAAELEARKLLMPHAQAAPHHHPSMYGMYPPMGGAPPHAKKRKKGPPQLPIDEEKIVFGKVISWHPREQWGHILPDQLPKADVKTAAKKKEADADAEAGAAPEATSSSSSSSPKKEEADASSSSTDADGDTAMNGGEADAAEAAAADKKDAVKKMAPIVAELDQIQTPPDRLPGLNRHSRVQFRVAKGPYPGTVTAVKVCNEDGTPIIFSTPSMERVQKKEPENDTVYKGTVAFFMKKHRAKPYGFLKPEGTTEKKDQVFCHIVETNFMPLKAGSAVEYKLAEDTGKGKSACCVTGPDGALPEYIKPKKRPRPANPPPPPNAGAPGWTFAPAPGGPGFHSFPPPGGAPGMWGPPADFYGGDVYAAADYSWPPSNNYQVPWQQSPQQRRRSGNFNNKKRKKSAPSSNAAVAVEERTCTVCNKTMTGKAPYETHMAGKAHAKKVQQQMQAGGAVTA